MRLLLPLLLLLLLGWWLGQLFSLPLPGPQDTPPTGQQAAVPALGPVAPGPGGEAPLPVGPGGQDDADRPQTDTEMADRDLQPPDGDRPEPPLERERPGQVPAPPAAPAPLLDLPSLPTAIVPDFVGDGPVRRELAERALIGIAEPGGRLRADRRSAGSVAPEPTAETFERAAERALRSRHVPAGERAIVRRFFERLQQEGK